MLVVLEDSIKIIAPEFRKIEGELFQTVDTQ